ncbi:hypothetical protein GCM10009608_45510 [Pseudonocardia alaniniphila]
MVTLMVVLEMWCYACVCGVSALPDGARVREGVFSRPGVLPRGIFVTPAVSRVTRRADLTSRTGVHADMGAPSIGPYMQRIA